MSFTDHTCVSVTCNTCQDAYTNDWTVHFDTKEQAIRELTESGWQFDGETAECNSCSARRLCKEQGHEFADWRPCGCGCSEGRQLIPAHTAPMETRWCDRDMHHEERPVVDQPGGDQ